MQIKINLKTKKKQVQIFFKTQLWNFYLKIALKFCCYLLTLLLMADLYPPNTLRIENSHDLKSH